MASLLITGGAGFIGANLVHYWLQRHPGDRLVIYDLLTYAGHLPSIAAALDQPGVTFVQGDIRDGERVAQLLRDHAIDTIVHLAAETHVDRSIAGPRAFIDTNVAGTHALLMAARQVWIEERQLARHRFHHVSTDEVYGSLGPDDPPFRETTPYAPNSPYAASKAASDFLVRAYHHTYGLATTTTNCSNNYGPYQFPEKLIPLFLINALHGRSLPVYGDGRNIRDWLHVGDHCRAIDLAIHHGQPGETYNVGGEAQVENLVLVDRLCQLVDQAFAADASLADRFPRCPAAGGTPTRSLLAFVTDRAGHDRRYAIDLGKTRRELGFAPASGLSDGLASTVSWYIANPAWWQPLVQRSAA